MTTHRGERGPRTPIPNSMKVYYATLVFLAFIIVISLTLAPQH